MDEQHEFGEADNRVFTRLAWVMGGVAGGWLALGLGYALIPFYGWGPAVIFVLLGINLWSARGAVQEIVGTEGRDVDHLRGALDALGAYFKAMAVCFALLVGLGLWALVDEAWLSDGEAPDPEAIDEGGGADEATQTPGSSS